MISRRGSKHADRAAVTDAEAIQWRLVLPMVNEAARLLDEDVTDSADAIDLATVFGTGFAPFRGGLRFADGRRRTGRRPKDAGQRTALAPAGRADCDPMPSEFAELAAPTLARWRELAPCGRDDVRAPMPTSPAMPTQHGAGKSVHDST